jgi:2,5-dihydroxypyridine 5,6-dioxygenase
MLRNLGPEMTHAARVLVRDVLRTKADETVLITADTASDMDAVGALQGAAHDLGAKASVLITPQLPLHGGFADPYIPETVGAAAKSCDVWIELNWPYMAGSNAYDEALEENRVRYYLAVGLTGEALVRLFGKPVLEDVFAVTDAFHALHVKGTPCRMTNQAGSDVSFLLGDPLPIGLCRAEEPGCFGLPGAVAIMPQEESVKGVLKLDTIFHEYYATALSDPITLSVDGRIREVSGGLSETRILDRALRRAGGGEYGYIIHFTCGVHPTARFTGDCFVEDQRVMGNNAVGMGLPFWVPGGGENHPDALLSKQSIWLDGEQIVRDGVIVGPPKLAELASKLF